MRGRERGGEGHVKGKEEIGSEVMALTKETVTEA